MVGTGDDPLDLTLSALCAALRGGRFAPEDVAARVVVRAHALKHLNAFITAPIVRAFGVTHLVATELEEADGRFTGRPLGTPCFREGKLARVDQWLAGLGQAWADFAATTFYSDSLNDIPLLERASRPVAVDPDPRLHALALERGWPVLSLR